MRVPRGLIAIVSALVLGAAPVAAERIRFDSVARDTNLADIFGGRLAYTDPIHGELQLPSQGSGPFPAMVIMHSSLGIHRTITEWAGLFNDMGVASLVVDSFTPRGILAESSAGTLSFPAGGVDALRALQVLRQDARIDPDAIGVIGFSRGAIATMFASFERFRAAVLGADRAKFALHIPFYGGCGQYAKTTGAPILTLVGSADDFVSAESCRRHTEVLRQQGSPAELVVYDGALHVFDTDRPREDMRRVQNTKNCRLLQNLDTFEWTLDGRTLGVEERTDYQKSCRGWGVVRGGDRRYAAASRERVKSFVAEHFKLPQ
ncbi:MAG: dienelactone hydrolase family protein [Proteobacteria bacterium]|nr:dienelactone hydrolase family protein [Pseudomonadota bacterium]